MLELFVVINCGPCAPFIGGCLASLESQTYRNWRALVTVDACGDETYDEALKSRNETVGSPSAGTRSAAMRWRTSYARSAEHRSIRRT